jgi:hypothetical protein
VLLDRTGEVIDGRHRTQIATELGLECPTRMIDVDATTDCVRVSLNWARSERALTTIQKYEIYAWLFDAYGGGSPAASVDRINADLEAAGETTKLTPGSMGRALRWRAASPKEKAAVREGKKSPTAVVDPRRTRSRKRLAVAPKVTPEEDETPKERADRERRESQAKTRLLDAQKQYESMHNAPRGKLNMPLVRRVQSIQEQLDDIYEVSPEDAVVAYGPELCRLFTPSRAEWWTKFCELNVERWHSEAPALPPVPNHRVIALAERDLKSTERAVLDWLRKQTTAETAPEDAASDTEAALAARCTLSQARGALTTLGNNGLAALVATIDGHRMYVAT